MSLPPCLRASIISQCVHSFSVTSTNIVSGFAIRAIQLNSPTPSWFSLLCVVEHRRAKVDLEVARIDSPDFVDATSFRQFWISWYNGTVTVGFGKLPGINTFLTYIDPAPSPVNHIALSGWDVSGTALVDYCKQHRIF